ncbi:hypothetical protein Cni_G10104 [Canna indica]|uniref:Uncharacterized protein n=1 Tax=Canna indica TaxID=4628 RepID=A0AAQ3K610_9LILI|nr:hypothetical protein Cni_G10104 [Canna indica]
MLLSPFHLLFFTVPTKLQTQGQAEEEEDMHKQCLSDSATLFPAILLDDFISLCTFLVAHPLHSAYLLFFLPYLLHLISFLSPLLLSTSLLLLVLLTVSSHIDEVPPSPAPEFLGRTGCVVLGVLKDKLHGHGGVDQLEQFVLMFLLPIDDASPSSHESAAEAVFGELFVDAPSDHETEESSFEDAEEIGGGESNSDAAAGDTPTSITVDGEHLVPNSANGAQSSATAVEDSARSESSAMKHSSNESIDGLQRYGSARKEREWKRTLACKLYEERMTYKLCKERKVAEGDEEMDLLWEAYEDNASEAKTRKKAVRKAKRIEPEEEEEEEEEDEEEDEEETVGQLCCLHALRLSTGKMNLGMGKNLMKISKALKGIKIFTRSKK